MPIVDGHLPDRLVDVDAGVVHQKVDTAFLVQHLFHDTAAGFGRRDIALMDRHRPSFRALLGCEGFRRVLVTVVAGGYVCAAVGETLGDGRSDASASAGHECDFALEHGGLLMTNWRIIVLNCQSLSAAAAR